jgi:thioredoxin reductase (NADPH)
LIVCACLLRRSLLIELGTRFRIVGSRFLPDSRRLREIAARNRLPHQFVDLEQDKAAQALLRRLGIRPEETPVVIWGDHVMRNPSNAEFARLLGIRWPAPGTTAHDFITVGADPAGAEFAERAVIQAGKVGAQIIVPAQALALEEAGGRYAVRLDEGTSIVGLAVLIATGARHRRLAVPGLAEFEGVKRLLRRQPGGSPRLRGWLGGRRGRRQLGRPGGAVPGRARGTGVPGRRRR